MKAFYGMTLLIVQSAVGDEVLAGLHVVEATVSLTAQPGISLQARICCFQNKRDIRVFPRCESTVSTVPSLVDPTTVEHIAG